jgi:hypothetical protein
MKYGNMKITPKVILNPHTRLCSRIFSEQSCNNNSAAETTMKLVLIKFRHETLENLLIIGECLRRARD